MVTTDTEKLPQAGEQGKQTSEPEKSLPASDAKGQTSAAAEAKAKEVTTTPNVKFDFDSPEFKKAVEKHAYSIAQSLKDKELKPIREKLAHYEEAEAEAKAEKQLQAEAEEWRSQGEDEAKIRSIQDAHKRNITDRKEIIKLAESHNELIDRAERAEAVLDLLEAMGVPVPQDKVDFLRKESEGNTKLRKLLAKEIAKELKQPASNTEEEKPSGPERPDPSTHSAPGGEDFNALPPREQISKALKELKRK